jgi:hypothetical protein
MTFSFASLSPQGEITPISIEAETDITQRTSLDKRQPISEISFPGDGFATVVDITERFK